MTLIRCPDNLILCRYHLHFKIYIAYILYAIISSIKLILIAMEYRKTNKRRHNENNETPKSSFNENVVQTLTQYDISNDILADMECNSPKN